DDDDRHLQPFHAEGLSRPPRHAHPRPRGADRVSQAQDAVGRRCPARAPREVRRAAAGTLPRQSPAPPHRPAPPPARPRPHAQPPELAPRANGGLAELCRKHADRFPAFVAALPMNNIDATLAEIDRAVKDLGARGVQLFTNVAGKPLSAAEFRPIFRRMAAHDVPVWLHPMRGPNFPDYASEQTSEAEIWFSFGWPYETSACVTRLIYSRLFDELPALKIITHHMGGMIPYFAGKINLGFRQIFFGTPERNPAAEDAGLKK